MNKVLTISGRGVITLPVAIRKKINGQAVMCCWDGNNVILRPVLTRDEFMQELDRREKNWETHGGTSLNDIS